MPEFTREVVVKRTPEAVFAVLDDLTQAKAWMPAIRKIEVLTPGQKMGVGFKWRETRRILGIFPIRLILTITGHEAPTHWRLLFNDGKMAATATFDLTPEGRHGTRVKFTEEVEDLQGKPARAEKMLQRMAKMDGDLLDRLKAHVEATVPAPAVAKVAAKPKAAKKAPGKKTAKKAR